jgi:hypothetical protein
MSDRSLSALVAAGVLDDELAALTWLLAERGVPLVAVSTSGDTARELRNAFARAMPETLRLSDQPLAGGVVHGSSLEDVLRMSGSGDEITDDARDLGLVLVVLDGEVTAAHYVRPVERDGAGHLQRRPPAVLAARNRDAAETDRFFWAITDELATRAGMELKEFDAEHRRRVKRLSPPVAADAPN